MAFMYFMSTIFGVPKSGTEFRSTKMLAGRISTVSLEKTTINGSNGLCQHSTQCEIHFIYKIFDNKTIRVTNIPGNSSIYKPIRSKYYRMGIIYANAFHFQ